MDIMNFKGKKLEEEILVYALKNNLKRKEVVSKVLKLLKISPQALWAYLNGKCCPKIENIYLLEDFFGVEKRYFN